jgi:uncharacterized protein YecT (DUF1311 family)
MSLSLTVAIASAALSLASSQESGEVRDRLAPVYFDCWHEADGDRTARLICVNTELARQDRILNDLYREQQADRSPVEQRRLREAQRAWIVARDARCRSAAVDADQHGQDRAVPRATCLLSETTERVIWLEAL